MVSERQAAPQSMRPARTEREAAQPTRRQAEAERGARPAQRSLQQQQVSDDAYVKMLEERGRKLRERSEGQSRQTSRDRES
jgi:hypothetical protein